MGGSGSGSAGGGSSSSTVDYPGYMKSRHEVWLSSLATLIYNLSYGASPYATITSYDPDTAIANIIAAACDFETIVGNLESTTDFATAISNATVRIDAMINTPTWVDPEPAAESEIADDVSAFQAIQDDVLENETLPRFRVGMRDINAVQTSAFVLGEAYLEASALRDVAKYQGEIRVKAFLLKDELMAKSAIAENDFNLKLELDRRSQIVNASDTLLRHILTKADLSRAVAHYIIEANRIKIVAKKEEADGNLIIDEKDAKWDIELYQYGANMLGAIAGGTVTTDQKGASSGASMLGGALSGAAAGAMIGSAVPGIGTAAGAIGGGLLGLASAFI
jgi:hypothetical protein